LQISARARSFFDAVSRARAHRVKSALGGLLILVTFSLVWPPSSVAEDSTQAAQNQIRSALEKWTRDFNARDSAEVCSLFAPDLISNYQGQPEGNYASLCARLKRSLDDPAKKYHYSLHIDEILVAGNLAVVRLKWTMQVRTEKVSQASQASQASNDLTIEEPGLDIFRRQPDGTWKIARYMAYPTETPCPASAP